MTKTQQILKSDLFGTVSRIEQDGRLSIRREIAGAPIWTRWIARRLMRREARILQALEPMQTAPKLLSLSRNSLERSFLQGKPMHIAKPTDAEFYRAASALLRQMHRLNITHNDLAKEPNILVSDMGQPAFIDFQLGKLSPARGRLFRLLAREDIRHLLKHKRSYCPSALSKREMEILATPSPLSKLYMKTVKPVYNFVTRRILKWSDREGAGDRGALR